LSQSQWIHAGTLEELRREGAKVIKGGIAVFAHEGEVYAVDNRCPHMGFPLHMGSLCDGILTCHWHHARFDVCSGGTLDLWADDIPAYDVKIEQDEVYVDSRPRNKGDKNKHLQRLREGLEQNLSIVIAKSVVALVEGGVSESEIAKVGVAFGTEQRSNGWGSGLTILSAMVNVLPKLDAYGRILALFHGLVHVARDASGRSPRHMVQPLPDANVPMERLAAWYRNCIEVRDRQGAERVLLTAIRKGADEQTLADMMLVAAGDHFYLDGGHTFDFHNKAFEMLRHTGAELTERILTSLVPLPVQATRSEELHSWMSPVNLVTPLREAFQAIASAGLPQTDAPEASFDEDAFIEQLLSDRPIDTIGAITEAFLQGVRPATIAQLTALAAAERIARFHTQNDFGDWIAVLHTFTHAHAVHESLNRSADPLTVRAVYYTAMSIYLDRFLNIPAAPRPNAAGIAAGSYSLEPSELLDMLNQRQQVAEAAKWTTHYIAQGGDIGALFNTLGHALLREDAEFHSFQMYEAAAIEYDRWSESTSPLRERAKETILLALTRYLAAHAPTARELPNTAKIAWRLQRGERLFEEG